MCSRKIFLSRIPEHFRTGVSGLFYWSAALHHRRMYGKGIDLCRSSGAKLRLSCNDEGYVDFQTIVQDVFLGISRIWRPAVPFVINGAERYIDSFTVHPVCSFRQSVPPERNQDLFCPCDSFQREPGWNLLPTSTMWCTHTSTGKRKIPWLPHCFVLSVAKQIKISWTLRHGRWSKKKWIRKPQ